MSSERQIGCLQSVARHLLPGGRFVFNLPNPTCDFILKSATCAGTDFVERGRYSLSDGSGTVLVEEAHAGVPLDQTITTRLRITRYDTDGKEVERGESTWTTRYLFRCEAVHLLYRCGFEVEELVGNYANGPITDGGQLIFQARLKDTASF